MTYKDIAKQFNIEIKNDKLFLTAFTHSSFTNEVKDGSEDYERLEFVGDGVLSLTIAALIYQCYPSMKQGIMSKLRSSLVRSTALANYARKYKFNDAIRLGHGEIASGGPNEKILEDVFEAFIGAAYLDQGFECIKNIIETIFLDDIKNFDLDDLTDYKSRLQEDFQASSRGNVVYEVIEETGLSQDKNFVVEVSVILEDKTVLKLGRGEGRNKKAAQEAAARDAYKRKAGQ